MRVYYDRIEDIKLTNGMLETPALNQNFKDKVEYKEHTYSLYKVYVLKLTGKERLLVFFKCLGKMLQSFGKLLSSQEFREEWLSAFKGKQIHAIYLPLEKEPQKIKAQSQQTSIPDAASLVNAVKQANEALNPSENKNENQAGLASDSVPANLTKMDGSHSTKDTQNSKEEDSIQEPTHAKPLEETKNEIKITLGDILARMPIEEGLNPYLLNDEDKALFRGYIECWFKREDQAKLNWTPGELASLLNAPEENVKNLLFRLQIFYSDAVPLNCDMLDWLFKSISDAIENRQRALMGWGVKMLWKPCAMVLGKENRFPEGMSFPVWRLEALSMFLALEGETLKKFLENKSVCADQEGFYKSNDIDKALNEATNGEINGILEKNRIQRKSLRFAVS